MTTTPKRRWSFSLQTMFVAVTMAAFGMAWFGLFIRQSRLAAKQAEQSKQQAVKANSAVRQSTR